GSKRCQRLGLLRVARGEQIIAQIDAQFCVLAGDGADARHTGQLEVGDKRGVILDGTQLQIEKAAKGQESHERNGQQQHQSFGQVHEVLRRSMSNVRRVRVLLAHGQDLWQNGDELLNQLRVETRARLALNQLDR